MRSSTVFDDPDIATQILISCFESTHVYANLNLEKKNQSLVRVKFAQLKSSTEIGMIIASCIDLTSRLFRLRPNFQHNLDNKSCYKRSKIGNV